MRRLFTRSRFDLAMLLLLAIAISSVILFRSLWASSPDAWEAFRSGLREACVDASGLSDPSILLDPVGTSSYGVALIEGARDGETAEMTLVCIATKSPEGLVDVEVTGPVGEFTRSTE